MFLDAKKGQAVEEYLNFYQNKMWRKVGIKRTRHVNLPDILYRISGNACSGLSSSEYSIVAGYPGGLTLVTRTSDSLSKSKTTIFS